MTVVKIIALALAAAAMTEGSACAMSSDSGGTKCHIAGGERLSAGSGGPAALCSAIDHVLTGHSEVRAVDVTVASEYRASALVTLTDGKALPVIHVAMADGPLGAASFTMLANSIARKLDSGAGK